VGCSRIPKSLIGERCKVLNLATPPNGSACLTRHTPAFICGAYTTSFCDGDVGTCVGDCGGIGWVENWTNKGGDNDTQAEQRGSC